MTIPRTFQVSASAVRLIKVSFKVNKLNKIKINFGPSATVRLIEGVRLIQVSLYCNIKISRVAG